MNQSDIAEGSAGTMAAIIQQIERGSMPMPQVSPLTRVAAKLRKNLELSSSEVLRIVEAAPEVAVQVIRLCNTAFYLRGRKPVADLPTGLVRLGNSTVATIIDTVAMRAFLKHESVAANILLRTMWHNSLYTSIGARMIAQQTGACDPNAALVFGLLHNIGEALLVKLLADRVPGAMNGLRPGSATHALIEEWHCFTGAVFLRKCNFPRPIVRLARCHHEPLSSPDHAVLNVAYQMALQHGQRYLGRGVDLAALEAAQAALKLTDSDCMELHRTIQVDLKAATLIVG